MLNAETIICLSSQVVYFDAGKIWQIVTNMLFYDRLAAVRLLVFFCGVDMILWMISYIEDCSKGKKITAFTVMRPTKSFVLRAMTTQI